MNGLKFKTGRIRENPSAKSIAELLAKQPMKLPKPMSDMLHAKSNSPKQKIRQSEPQKRIWVSYRLFHYYYPKKNRQGLGAHFSVEGRMSFHTKFGLHVANADHRKWQQEHRIDDRVRGGRRIASDQTNLDYAGAIKLFANTIGFFSQSILFRKDGQKYNASIPASQCALADDPIPFPPAVPFTAIWEKNIRESNPQSVSATGSQPALSTSVSIPVRGMDIDGMDDFSFVPIAVPMNLFVSAIPIFSAIKTYGNLGFNNPNPDFSLTTTYPNVLKNVFGKWHGRGPKSSPNNQVEIEGLPVHSCNAIQNKKQKYQESAYRYSLQEIQNPKIETVHRKPITEHRPQNTSHLSPITGNMPPETMCPRAQVFHFPFGKLETGNWKQATPHIYSLRPHRIKQQSVIGAEALPE